MFCVCVCIDEEKSREKLQVSTVVFHLNEGVAGAVLVVGVRSVKAR